MFNVLLKTHGDFEVLLFELLDVIGLLPETLSLLVINRLGNQDVVV